MRNVLISRCITSKPFSLHWTCFSSSLFQTRSCGAFYAASSESRCLEVYYRGLIFNREYFYCNVSLTWYLAFNIAKCSRFHTLRRCTLPNWSCDIWCMCWFCSSFIKRTDYWLSVVATAVITLLPLENIFCCLSFHTIDPKSQPSKAPDSISELFELLFSFSGILSQFFRPLSLHVCDREVQWKLKSSWWILHVRCPNTPKRTFTWSFT